MKEYTWYAFTDNWILALKFGIPKIQFTDHMKLKKKEVWVLRSFLEGVTKYSQNTDTSADAKKCMLTEG